MRQLGSVPLKQPEDAIDVIQHGFNKVDSHRPKSLVTTTFQTCTSRRYFTGGVSPRILRTRQNCKKNLLLNIGSSDGLAKANLHLSAS